jgi:hypothetical protein
MTGRFLAAAVSVGRSGAGVSLPLQPAANNRKPDIAGANIRILLSFFTIVSTILEQFGGTPFPVNCAQIIRHARNWISLPRITRSKPRISRKRK